MKGRVIKSTGSWYQVQSSKKVYNARIKGKFRIEGLKVTNPIAVGDNVVIELEDIEEQSAIITEILPRKNFVVRQSPRKKHFVHLLASNVDQAFLIVTIKEPQIKLGFIDRFLLMVSPYDIPVSIIFNKSDIYSKKDLEYYHSLEKIYSSIGYKVLLVSGIKNQNIDKLKTHTLGQTTLISGQSGVGKSSLMNKLSDFELNIKTTDLSTFTGKGQHTTTFAEMHTIAANSYIIDTPGIKTLSFNYLEVLDVAHNFKEFFEHSKDCKFANCTHRNEPKCAVKQGVKDDIISEIRYHNYLCIIEEIEDQNYWERHKISK